MTAACWKLTAATRSRPDACWRRSLAFIDSDSIPSGDAPHVAHPLPRSLMSLLTPSARHYARQWHPGLALCGAGRAITSNVIVRSPPRPEDITRLEHSLATLAEQLNHRLRGLDSESKTILSAHLSLIQDEEFGGTIPR